MPTLTKEVRLIMAENGIDPKTGLPRNNYKYWNAKLYDDGNWTAEWGRVGCENPDSGTWNESNKTMDSVVRSKIKKGYSHQKTIGEAVAQGGSGSVVKNTDLPAIATAKRRAQASRGQPVIEYKVGDLVYISAGVQNITGTVSRVWWGTGRIDVMVVSTNGMPTSIKEIDILLVHPATLPIKAEN